MKILCLQGIYNIKNISLVYDMIKEDEYDQVDYSNASLDDYVTIFLDSYNDHVKLTLPGPPNSSFIILKELKFCVEALKFASIIFRSCKYDFQKKYFYSNVVADLYFMGVESIFVIAIISFFFGINLGYQSYVQLNSFGMVENGLSFVVISGFKQFGILISLIILGTKYSSGIIAKIGFMKVSEEWIALKIMQVDPKIFLLKTKIYSLIILVPFFAYFAIIFFVLGVFCVFHFLHGITWKFFFITIRIKDFKTLFTPLFKGIFIGATLGVFSSYEAYLIEKSSDNILKGLSHGVVIAIVMSLLIGIFFDLLFKL